MSMHVKEQPLISFVLLTYNQERFIREAVEAALAQTYSPLEIVLSDDCSTDNTFAIMQQMAAEYHGPHSVRLNRPQRNLGLADHINQVVSLSCGEFMVFAAGDDVSHSGRVSKLASVWFESGLGSCCAYSGISFIDLDSRVIPGQAGHFDFTRMSLEEFASNPRPLLCSYGFTRDLFTRFPSLNSELRNEDFAIPFRALLLGSAFRFVPDPLVSYRKGAGHDANELGSNLTRHIAASWFIRQLSMLQQLRDDLEFWRSQLRDDSLFQSLARKLDHHREQGQWMLDVSKLDSSWQALKKLLRRIAGRPQDAYSSCRDFFRARNPYYYVRLQAKYVWLRKRMGI